MNLTRREVLGGGAALAAGAIAGAGGASPARPNILLVGFDDLNGWVGPLGDAQAVTPAMDALAARGVTFGRAYCCGPSSGPSRSAVLTGLSPATTGIYAKDARRGLAALVPDALVLPRRFAAEGWHTVGAGKVFSAPRVVSVREAHARGMAAFPLPAAADDATAWDAYQGLGDDPFPAARAFPLNGFGDDELDWGPGDAPEAALPDHRLAAWAAARLAGGLPEPFLMAVGFRRPHLPWYPPAADLAAFPPRSVAPPPVREDDLDDVPAVARRWAEGKGEHAKVLAAGPGAWAEAVRCYRACVRYADRQLATVLAGLEAGGAAARTVVVVWSDHGVHLGTKRHWGKYTLWEEATRVPLIVAGPGVAAGALCGRVASLLDLYPTLLDLAGLAPDPAHEGRSLAPLLADPGRPWPHPAVMTWGLGNHAARSARWRYIRYRGGAEELYDHDADPHEWTNLAARAEHAAVREELAAALPWLTGEVLRQAWRDAL